MIFGVFLLGLFLAGCTQLTSITKTCSSDSDCDGWKFCSGDKCILRPGMCSANDDCEPWQSCATFHVCYTSPNAPNSGSAMNGVSCKNTCLYGLVCDTGQCRLPSGKCFTNADCPTYAACIGFMPTEVGTCYGNSTYCIPDTEPVPDFPQFGDSWTAHEPYRCQKYSTTYCPSKAFCTSLCGNNNACIPVYSNKGCERTDTQDAYDKCPGGERVCGCPEGTLCYNSVCVPECTMNQDCPPNWVCTEYLEKGKMHCRPTREAIDTEHGIAVLGYVTE